MTDKQLEKVIHTGCPATYSDLKHITVTHYTLSCDTATSYTCRSLKTLHTMVNLSHSQLIIQWLFRNRERVSVSLRFSILWTYKCTCKMVIVPLADKPTRGESSRGLEDSRTRNTQLADSWFFKYRICSDYLLKFCAKHFGESTSPRLDWPRVGLWANCPVSARCGRRIADASSELRTRRWTASHVVRTKKERVACVSVDDLYCDTDSL